MAPAQKTRGIIIILGIYVLIALVGFAIVYAVKAAFFQSKNPVATTVPVTTIAPAPHPSGWRTFQNSSVNFTFSYPQTLTVKTNAYGMGVANIEMRSADNTNPSDSPNYQILLVPKVLAQAAGQDFDNYYALPNNTSKVVSSPLSSNKAQQNVTKLSNTSVNGHRAFTYRSQATAATSSNQAESGEFIEDGDKLLLISGGARSKTELDQIIQSIKFTE